MKKTEINFTIIGYDVRRWKDKAGWNWEAHSAHGELHAWRSGLVNKPAKSEIEQLIINAQ